MRLSCRLLADSRSERRSTLGHREYLDLPSSLLALLSVLAWAALNDPFPELIAPTSYPALWLGMAAAVMLNPFPVLYRQTRFWLIRKIGVRWCIDATALTTSARTDVRPRLGYQFLRVPCG